MRIPSKCFNDAFFFRGGVAGMDFWVGNSGEEGGRKQSRLSGAAGVGIPKTARIANKHRVFAVCWMKFAGHDPGRSRMLNLDWIDTDKASANRMGLAKTIILPVRFALALTRVRSGPLQEASREVCCW